MDKSNSFSFPAKVPDPNNDKNRVGIFSTRLYYLFIIYSPRRPNPIGISVVKIESIENNIINISCVDIINDTPIIGIIPYSNIYNISDAIIPKYDKYIVEILNQLNINKYYFLMKLILIL